MKRVEFSIRWARVKRVEFSIRWPRVKRVAFSIRWPRVKRVAFSIRWPRGEQGSIFNSVFLEIKWVLNKEDLSMGGHTTSSW